MIRGWRRKLQRKQARNHAGGLYHQCRIGDDWVMQILEIEQQE